LREALALGFRGAEADVFRVGADLLVGHERREVRPGYSLSRHYLEPLREQFRACGRILSDSTPFYLNVELKETDSLAFTHLVSELRQYEELFRGSPPRPGPAVRVTLVGWWPRNGGPPWPDYLRVQSEMERGLAARHSDHPVGLVSIDFGKVVRWRGRGAVPPADSAILAWARELSARAGVPLRVHHAPAQPVVYQWLLSESVTLIGTTNLTRTRELLSQLGEGQVQGSRTGSSAPGQTRR
jgi:hypothetical protein